MISASYLSPADRIFLDTLRDEYMGEDIHMNPYSLSIADLRTLIAVLDNTAQREYLGEENIEKLRNFIKMVREAKRESKAEVKGEIEHILRELHTLPEWKPGFEEITYDTFIKEIVRIIDEKNKAVDVSENLKNAVKDLLEGDLQYLLYEEEKESLNGFLEKNKELQEHRRELGELQRRLRKE